MKTCTKCNETKPLDCFHAQKKGAFGVTSQCKPCTSLRAKQWHTANRERHISLQTAYRLRTREQATARSKAWREANKKRAAATAAAWSAANKDKKRAATAKRRAALLNAIPKWADLEQMEHFYRWAKEATQATGIVFEVDHVYPLQSDTVCGLHCWENLQLITRYANRRKANTMGVSMVTGTEVAA